jgi:hypothetical protein
MDLTVKNPKSPLLATKAQLLPHNAPRPDVLQLADRLSNRLSDLHSLPSGLPNDQLAINR